MKGQLRAIARSAVPASAKDSVRGLLDIAIPNDIGSYRALRRAKHARVVADPVPISVRQLRGERIVIRPGTRDPNCVHYIFVDQFHMPPADHPMPPAPVIWDLGSNIGLTAAHMAVRFPRARLWGVELDAANAELARRNVAAWADRCTILTAAVWTEDGELEYAKDAIDEDAYSVMVEKAADQQVVKAPALSLNTLLERCGSPAQIDYVKMDIEGAEAAVLREHTEWASRVRCIKIETHRQYSIAEGLADLARLGFRARRDDNHIGAVIGIRDE